MGKGNFITARRIRLPVFSLLFVCAAALSGASAQSAALTREFAAGEWQGTPVFGVTPLVRYYADGAFETGLTDAFGNRHPVCKGNYTISGGVITETVSYVEDSFWGKMSRIKAGVTVMHVTLQADGTLLSEDAPFGGRVVFTKSAP